MPSVGQYNELHLQFKVTVLSSAIFLHLIRVLIASYKCTCMTCTYIQKLMKSRYNVMSIVDEVYWVDEHDEQVNAALI